MTREPVTSGNLRSTAPPWGGDQYGRRALATERRRPDDEEESLRRRPDRELLRSGGELARLINFQQGGAPGCDSVRFYFLFSFVLFPLFLFY